MAVGSIAKSGRYANRETEDWFHHQVLRGAIIVGRDGTVFNIKTNRFIGALGSGGYLKISMKDFECDKIRHIQVHRLVFRVYKGPIPSGCEIDHIDCNKLNNSENNLQAVSPKENVANAVRNGLTAARDNGARGNKWHLLRKSYGNMHAKGIPKQ